MTDKTTPKMEHAGYKKENSILKKALVQRPGNKHCSWWKSILLVLMS